MRTNLSSSTLADWLSAATQKLDQAGIATSRLDCLVLIEDALGHDKSYVLAHSEIILPSEVLQKLAKQLERRANHEPLAYIRGKAEFYGREFVVSPDTLEPRPETETMIDLVKQLDLPKGSRIADVGAGSGAIGITLALEMKDLSVDMYEISAPAVAIAKTNITRLQPPHCRIFKNDLLSGVEHGYDVVVANLPYVPDTHTINQAAMQEPRLAIFGGADGLNLYRRLFAQISANQHSLIAKNLQFDSGRQYPKFVLTESLPFQHQELAKIARRSGYKLDKTEDFIQVFSQLVPLPISL